MMFFIFNGTRIPQKTEPLFEAGHEIPTETQRVYYLLPDNELELTVNEEFNRDNTNPKGRKYKNRDPHRIIHKNFHR